MNKNSDAHKHHHYQRNYKHSSLGSKTEKNTNKYTLGQWNNSVHTSQALNICRYNLHRKSGAKWSLAGGIHMHASLLVPCKATELKTTVFDKDWAELLQCIALLHVRLGNGQMPLMWNKCTKHQFIHWLTANCNDWHIENSKNHKKVILTHHPFTSPNCQCANGNINDHLWRKIISMKSSFI